MAAPAADNRLPLPKWLELRGMLDRLDSRRTPKAQRAKLEDALATWEAPAKAHGFQDARAWAGAGFRPGKAAAEAGARYAANNPGIPPEALAVLTGQR